MPSKRLIDRDLSKALFAERERPIISTVIGPRQVGKTTLLQQLGEGLKSTEGVSAEDIVSFNFDDIELRSRLSHHPGGLRREIEILLGRPISSLRRRVYVFLDEAQKVPLLFDSVKLLFDEHANRLKFYISGSSSLEVQRRAAETLAGRIRYHYLLPLTTREILRFHGLWGDAGSVFELLTEHGPHPSAPRALKNRLQEIQAALWVNRDSVQALREKMLLFGSLPGVYLEPSEDEKWLILHDYTATYIERDVRLLEGVGNLDLFSPAVSGLAAPTRADY